MNSQLSHEDIVLLLPFYVNGSLEGDEKQQVETAIREQPALQEEVTLLRKMHEHIQSIPLASNSPGEMGLKRLQQKLPSHQSNNHSTQRWRLVAVAASFLLIVQTSVMMITSGPDVYQQAGETQPTPVLLMTFQPGATESEIRSLLLENDLTIIDGPSSLGIYKLSSTREVTSVLNDLEQSEIIESVQLNP